MSTCHSLLLYEAVSYYDDCISDILLAISQVIVMLHLNGFNNDWLLYNAITENNPCDLGLIAPLLL